MSVIPCHNSPVKLLLIALLSVIGEYIGPRARCARGRDTSSHLVASCVGVGMRIDDGVREAHLSHFCPGGLGVAVTSSGPVGMPARPAHEAGGDQEAEGNRLLAAGDPCGRCGRPLLAG